MCNETWDAIPRGLHFLYTSPASERGDQWSSLMPHSSILPGQGYLEGQTQVAVKKRQFLHLCASPHVPGSFLLHILNSAFTSSITSLRQFPACQDSLRSLDSSTLSISGESGMLKWAAWVQVTGALWSSGNSMGHEDSKTHFCLQSNPAHAPTCIVLGHHFLSNILCTSEQKKEFPLDAKSSPICSSRVLSAFLLQWDQDQHALISKTSYSLSLSFCQFQQQLQLLLPTESQSFYIPHEACSRQD